MTKLKCSKNNLSVQLLNKMVHQPILALLLFFQSSAVLASNICHEIYTASEIFLARTKNLTPAVQEAIDRSISNLAELRLSLDLAQASGRSSMAITALNADYRRKEQALVEYLLKYKIMTKAEFIEKIKQEIAQLQGLQETESKQGKIAKEEEVRRKEEQGRQISVMMIDGNRAIFHRIEPGSFKMGELENQVDVTISKSFDMMATQTTQVIWKKIADLANLRFINENKSNADPSYFKGDTLPVERVSFREIQKWIEGLNELSQLGEPALVDLIPDHRQGDVYRLPTEAEWEFVARGRGQFKDTYHFGDQHGWYSGTSTHSVAEKLPLVINGREFYDMYGNVWEWVQDRWQDRLSGGTDPQGSTDAEVVFRTIRGGAYDSLASRLRSAERDSRPFYSAYYNVGFRLAREGR